MRLTMREKQSLTDVTGPRYRKARKAEKTVILNEFCENTGYNRKYAIGLLKNAGRIQMRRRGIGQVQNHRQNAQEAPLRALLRPGRGTYAVPWVHPGVSASSAANAWRLCSGRTPAHGRLCPQRPGTRQPRSAAQPPGVFSRRCGSGAEPKAPAPQSRGRYSNSGFPSALSGAGVINRRLRARSGKRRINFTCGRQYRKNDNACAGQRRHHPQDRLARTLRGRFRRL